MAVKLPGPLVRTNFLDPTQGNYPTAGNPNLAGFDPKNVLPRSGPTSHGEDKVDVEQYNRPVGQLHGNGMHGAGVAWGFQVSATVGQTGVTFAPGVALEPAGRHIYLALNGQAEIGPTADQPGANPNLVSVTGAGVVLPTLPLTGDYFAVVQWWETFDQASWINSGGQVAQFNHTPWLQLVQAANYNPDLHVVLGKVHLDAQSKVTALSYGDVGGRQRTSVTVPAQSIHFRRAVNSAGPKADSLPWGEMRAREGGGLQIASDFIAAQTSGGVESVVIDTPNGTLKVGTQGLEGDVWVLDAQGNFAVTLDSGPAQVLVGGPGNAGKVRVKNAQRADLITLDGASGDMWFMGKLQDPNHQHNGIGHDLLKWLPELTGGGFTALHRHLNSGDATQAHVVWLYATGGARGSVSDQKSVFFPSGPRNVFACIAITSINPYGGLDDDDALLPEVYRVDGNDHRADGYRFGGNPNHLGSDGDDANLRAPFFSGFAQTIEFRLRSLNDQNVGAIGIVFPQTV
jgi:hypothetical protein